MDYRGNQKKIADSIVIENNKNNYYMPVDTIFNGATDLVRPRGLMDKASDFGTLTQNGVQKVIRRLWVRVPSGSLFYCITF